MDIGCGVAGIDVLISKHFHNNLRIYLLDKSVTEKQIHYGFQKRGAFYNSLYVAQELLTENGIQKENISLLEATDNNDILIDQQLDLVISVLSWGHHYPVDVYLERVFELLKSGGRLILEVRKKTGGIELLQKKFGTLQVISDFDTHQRVLCIKA